jgi:hypothetical protein
MQEIKSMALDRYQVVYTATTLSIGCQQHSIEDWWEFSDHKIRAMDRMRALNWWRKWKPILQQILEMSPATPTQ